MFVSLTCRVSCLQEELVSLRLQCSSVYRKGSFSQALGSIRPEHTSQRTTDADLSLGQTLLGAVGAAGAVGAMLLRRPMARSQLVAMSSSEDEGSLRFIYELLGWVEETQVCICCPESSKFGFYFLFKSISFFYSKMLHLVFLKDSNGDVVL